MYQRSTTLIHIYTNIWGSSLEHPLIRISKQFYRTSIKCQICTWHFTYVYEALKHFDRWPLIPVVNNCENSSTLLQIQFEAQFCCSNSINFTYCWLRFLIYNIANTLSRPTTKIILTLIATLSLANMLAYAHK